MHPLYTLVQKGQLSCGTILMMLKGFGTSSVDVGHKIAKDVQMAEITQQYLNMHSDH